MTDETVRQKQMPRSQLADKLAEEFKDHPASSGTYSKSETVRAFLEGFYTADAVPPLEVFELVEALKTISYATEREEYPCPGSHSYYSSMAHDTRCDICGESEDGLGRDLVRYVPTRAAQCAIDALKKWEVYRAGKQ